MMIIDTHAHLYTEDFDEDREEVICRAVDAGVKRFFLPAIDASHTSRMERLVNAYPDLMFPMCGLHPTSVGSDWMDEIEKVKRQLESDNTYYAVGEIGIDAYWDRTFLEDQKRAFSTQICLAKRYDLPIVIHCREAFDEVFEVLEPCRYSNLRGIFHCFTGTEAQARIAISHNMLLGIGGVVTFKNGKIDQFLKSIDISNIVLETDAPYLAPTPFRGKRNESAYLINILEKVASIYDTTTDHIANITTQNAIRVFDTPLCFDKKTSKTV